MLNVSIKLVSRFWDRVVNKPKETTYANLDEGLDLLTKDRSVMHVSQGLLKGYFKKNPSRQQVIL
jgi:hypothetical protein